MLSYCSPFLQVFMQFFTAYICKATDRIFCSHKAFLNKTTYYGFVVSLAILFICTYIPGIQDILSSANWTLWLMPVALVGGFASLVIEQIVRMIKRSWRKRRHL